AHGLRAVRDRGLLGRGDRADPGHPARDGVDAAAPRAERVLEAAGRAARRGGRGPMNRLRDVVEREGGLRGDPLFRRGVELLQETPPTVVQPDAKERLWRGAAG